jgi:type II secretory pathway pseudopilin PulG
MTAGLMGMEDMVPGKAVARGQRPSSGTGLPPPPRPPRARRQAGFGMIEQLVTIGSLISLSLISAPIFSRSMQAFKLAGATREVLGQMQRARMVAVTQDARYSVKLNTDGKLVVSRYNVTTNTWTIDQAVKPMPSDSPNVVVTATAEIIFAPNGSAASAGTVTLTNPDGRQRQIVVSTGGRIRVL